MRTSIPIALALALGACVEIPESDPDAGSSFPDAQIDAEIVEPEPLPERIAGFCLLDGCDQSPWSAEGGWAGDLECQEVIGSVMAVCTDDEICHVGIRFHGAPFGVVTPPEETCPNDTDENGQCAFGGAWYALCPWTGE